MTATTSNGLRSCQVCGARIGAACFECSSRRAAYFVHAMRQPSGAACECVPCATYRAAHFSAPAVQR